MSTLTIVALLPLEEAVATAAVLVGTTVLPLLLSLPVGVTTTVLELVTVEEMVKPQQAVVL